LVRFTTEERLDEITAIHEDMGAPIFNPHRYTLEEGGMKQTDEVQLAFKREADPKGLLNPGKMIAWEDPHLRLPLRQDVPVPRARSGGGVGSMHGSFLRCGGDLQSFRRRECRPSSPDAAE
jgi:hypothetical protein